MAVTNGTSRLWIRTLDSLTARELQDTDGARLPFWSPDSRSLGFFTNGDLRRIDVAGGAAAVLARAPDPRGGAWNADGTIVFSPGGVRSPAARERLRWNASTAHQTGRRAKPAIDGLSSCLTVARSSTTVRDAPTPSTSRRWIDPTTRSEWSTHSPRPCTSLGRETARDTSSGSCATRWWPSRSIRHRPSSRDPSYPCPAPRTSPRSRGTGRASVTVSNDGTLLYSTGGSRYQLAWFRPDGTALGTVGRDRSVRRAAIVPRRR